MKTIYIKIALLFILSISSSFANKNTKELTLKIEEHMLHYNELISKDLEQFNAAFAKLKLDYLTLK